MATHEPVDRQQDPPLPSERSFGFVFAAFCAIVAGLRHWHGHADARWWLAGGVAFATLALLWTAPLRPLNRLWARFGLLLHAIVNPVLMGLIFFLAILPTGVLMRLAGKDPLRLKREPSAATYWVDCAGAERRGTMTDQF